MLKNQKCPFRVTSVKFLKGRRRRQGISQDPDKFCAIQKLHPPTDVAGVRRVLRMINHMGFFCRTFCTVLIRTVFS